MDHSPLSKQQMGLTQSVGSHPSWVTLWSELTQTFDKVDGMFDRLKDIKFLSLYGGCHCTVCCANSTAQGISKSQWRKIIKEEEENCLKFYSFIYLFIFKVTILFV